MYSLINENRALLLSEIALQAREIIDDYAWLLEQLPNIDASADVNFQDRYRRYWQLDVSGMGAGYMRAYFQRLQELKGQGTGVLDPSEIATSLENVSQRKDGTPTYQFSYATKLVHMLCRTTPVYDSRIQSFYFLPSTDTLTTPEKKASRLRDSYEFLCREYSRVLTDGLLAPTIVEFRSRFEKASAFSDVKIIDTLIWRFVTWLQEGAVRDRRIKYR